AGFCHRGLEIFDPIFAETHQLGDGGGGAHGHLCVPHAGGKAHLHRGWLGGGGAGAAHAGISAAPLSAARHSTSAVMSSPCGPPSTNSPMAAHNASRIPSAWVDGHCEKWAISRS